MLAVFLLLAAPVGAPSTTQFEAYIKGCQDDFERGMVETDEMFRTHKLPPPRQRFWSKLPVKEQPSAKAICAAWLQGIRYQLGKTKFIVSTPKARD